MSGAVWNVRNVPQDAAAQARAIRDVFEQVRKANRPVAPPPVVTLSAQQFDALTGLTEALRGRIKALETRLAVSRSHWKARAKRARRAS